MATRQSEARSKFQRNIRAQMRRRGIQIDERLVRMLGTLADLQARTIAVLAGAPSDFDAFRLPDLLREVEHHIEVWQRRARQEMEEAARAAWEIGPDMVDGPLSAAGLETGSVILPDSLLRSLAEFSVDHIADLGPVARRRIGDEIRLGVLGGKTPDEVMRAVGRSLGDPGPFGYLSFRSEMIVRTEMGRIHARSAWMRGKSAAAKVPGLKKQWVWSGVSRQSHSAANGQVREWDKAFTVAGEQLMYPRDLSASPGNTINCGCFIAPWHADF